MTSEGLDWISCNLLLCSGNSRSLWIIFKRPYHLLWALLLRLLRLGEAVFTSLTGRQRILVPGSALTQLFNNVRSWDSGRASSAVPQGSESKQIDGTKQKSNRGAGWCSRLSMMAADWECVSLVCGGERADGQVVEYIVSVGYSQLESHGSLQLIVWNGL